MPATDDLYIAPEVCGPIEVDAGHVRAAGVRLGVLAREISRQDAILAEAAATLASARAVPGGYLSALWPHRELESNRARLRRARVKIDDLAAALEAAAGNYVSTEAGLASFMGGLGQPLWHSWGPSPRKPLFAAASRFYGAAAQGQLQGLQHRRGWLIGQPASALSMLFAAGQARHSRLIGMGPTAWAAMTADAARVGYLLPRAFGPLRDPQHPGIDRTQGARLSRALAGLVIPGRDVGAAAGVTASGIDALHAGLGHRRVRVHELPPRGADGNPGRPPVRGFGEAISVMAELDVRNGAELGEIRIDRVTSEQGEHSWQVFIPGGQGLNLGNVHSLAHAPAAVGATPTASVAMVAAALRRVGARKGEPIMMVGHSHGGITASMFANNPRLRAEFDVPLVVAAGSPVDRHEIRPDTHVVSIEHTEDFVPGLDGVARQHKPGMTRVERSLADSGDPVIAAGRGVRHHHDYPTYADTAALIDEHPDLAHLRGYAAALIPEGRVETYRFRGEITR